jgi:hypothetical protein
VKEVLFVCSNGCAVWIVLQSYVLERKVTILKKKSYLIKFCVYSYNTIKAEF